MKKRFFPILAVALLAIFLTPSASAWLDCGSTCETPSSQTCNGFCNGSSGVWTCATWIQAGCGGCIYQPLPPKEVFLLTLEAQAAQEHSSEALPAEPMF